QTRAAATLAEEMTQLQAIFEHCTARVGAKRCELRLVAARRWQVLQWADGKAQDENSPGIARNEGSLSRLSKIRGSGRRQSRPAGGLHRLRNAVRH
ncbi:MAG TPA: hypothetical protein VN541_19765, partial [Tepidisphaeraceae bacterium]|nr:hypothetical protein [Tepidisphaeraceae bacterium]